MSLTNDSPAPAARVIRLLFRSFAIVEAFTWVAMLTAMLFKYVINGYAFGVTVAGWAHGTVWIGFVLSCLLAAVYFRWPVWVAAVGVVTSMLPFLTVPFEFWMERSGRLRGRQSSAEALPVGP